MTSTGAPFVVEARPRLLPTRRALTAVRSRAGALAGIFNKIVDDFIPASMRLDPGTRIQARLFLISHLFGPWLGFTVVFYLRLLDPDPGFRLWVPAVAVAAFWAFPVMLRISGRFTLIALLSVQNLAFIVLFVSYFYGGLSSPFLPWLIVALLLAVFYLGDSAGLRAIAFGLVLTDLLVFYGAHRLGGNFPTRVPLEALTSAGLVSLVCAGLYATMAALYYARILASRSELEREMQRHKQTAAMLLEAKDAAEAANRAKTEFLATMSHELRTPLNAVIGFSEIIMTEIFGPIGHANYQGYAKDIHDSGSHLLGIINDILDISKAEAGTLDLTESDIDCGDMIGTLTSLLRPRLEKAGLDFEVAVPDTLPRLRADLRMVKQMVLNLLANAIKFTPRGGRVTLQISADPRAGFVFAIRDTGIGIANADLERVLLPFVQVDGSLSRQHEGTGLGLPLVAVMVRLHGGRFDLASTLGSGTHARVAFPPNRLIWPETGSDAEPCERRADADPAALPPGAESPGPSGAWRILVVEDDPDLRALLQRMLERAGYAVVSAGHGKAALDCLQLAPVDLVVTDMLMPEMDGVELMRILRRDRPDLPVIAVSGVEEWREYQRIATRLGAKAALRKPVTRADLTRAVDSVLARP